MQLKPLPKKILTAALTALAVLGAVTVALPLLFPFLLAYALALAAEPGVQALSRGGRMPRCLAAAITVTGLFAGVGLVLWFFCRVGFSELQGLVRQLPQLLQALQGPTESVRLWLEDLAGRLPDGFGPAAQAWVDRLFSGGSLLAGELTARLTRLVSGVVTGLPGKVMGLVTTVLATYMISSSLSQVKSWLRTRLPPAWVKKLGQIAARIHTALGSYCKAQLKLMGLVFVLLTLGLWVLGVDFPLLFGALIALVDALPVFGSGTVLLPWALVAFLQADKVRGIGLLLLYATLTLTRAALEPRVVGRQMGLHPLLTLMAFYLGYRLMGVAGMILLPIGAMVSKQLVDLLEPVRERQSPGHEADRTRISCTRSQAGARKRADN